MSSHLLLVHDVVSAFLSYASSVQLAGSTNSHEHDTDDNDLKNNRSGF